MGSQDHLDSQVYDVVMIAMTILGVVVNISAIIILQRKNQSSMFHSLLKILAVYDLIVIVGCTTLYAVPNEWRFFQWKIYPFLLPWLLPIVQIAMLSSVYCTVVMSFERYVRICHLCQLRNSSMFNEENFKFYVLAFTLGPLLFYLPKFFEIRTETTVQAYTKTLNCSEVLDSKSSIFNEQEWTKDERDCFEANFSLEVNVTRTVEFYDVVPTDLRMNSVYYKIYCLACNSILASIIPLLSLFYLNIRTIMALSKMKKNMETSPQNQPGKSDQQTPPKDQIYMHQRRCSSVLYRRRKSVSTSELSEFMMNGNSEEASSYCAQHRRSFDVNNPMIKEDEILVVTTEIEYSEDNLDQEEKKAEICHLRKLKRHISAPELIDGCINHLPAREESKTRTNKRKFKKNKSLSVRRRTSSQQTCITQSSNVMRKQENRLTRISLGIVSLYIVCHFWRVLPTAYEALYSEDGTVLSHWPSWLIHVYHLSHTLIVTNSAINFLLYVVL